MRHPIGGIALSWILVLLLGALALPARLPAQEAGTPAQGTAPDQNAPPAGSETPAAAPAASPGETAEPAPPSEPGSVIKGKLLGSNGKPMPRAIVEVLRSESRGPEAQGLVRPDGTFRLSVPGTGMYLLRCAGVGHQPLILPIVLDHPDSLSVDARLAAYELDDKITDVRVIGSFNRFSYNQSVPMEKQADGTWTATIPARGDSVGYELIGIEKNGRSVAGTDAAKYDYDGGGDFAAVVPADSLTVIHFDPKKFPRGKGKAQLELDSAHRNFERYRPILEDTRRLLTLYQQQFAVAQQAQMAGEQNRPEVATRFQRLSDSLQTEIAKADPGELVRRAQKADDAGERDLLWISRLRLEGFKGFADQGIVDQVEAAVPATSPWWSLDADLMALEVMSDGDVAWKTDYLQKALDGSPDPAVKAGALLCFLSRASRERRREEMKTLYDRMQSEFGRFPAAQYAKMLYNPEEKIREGEIIPDFSCMSLDQTGQRYKSSDFQGKILLIDFWATWCQPCVGEMPMLHSMWEKYKTKGLEILSLSFDRAPEKVATFRSGQWKMPWKNGFVEGGFESPVAQAFQITSIPKPILVDGSGTIIATGGKLRGRALERTLEHAFKRQASEPGAGKGSGSGSE